MNTLVWTFYSSQPTIMPLLLPRMPKWCSEHGEELRQSNDGVRGLLPKHFDCKVGQICGICDGAEVQDVEILRKKVGVVVDRGWYVEGNEKHATALVKFFNLENANGTDAPGSKDANEEDDETPLEDGLYPEFRSAAGLALSVAEEYIPINFAVSQVLREA